MINYQILKKNKCIEYFNFANKNIKTIKKLNMYSINSFDSFLLLQNSLINFDTTSGVVFIFEVSPMTQALPGVWYARRRQIPCYLYVQDLWPDNVEIITDICATAKGYESLYMTQERVRRGA